MDQLDNFLDQVQCIECQATVHRKQKYCGECGTKVDISWFKVRRAADVDVCSGTKDDGTLCGQILDASHKFCFECGQKNPMFALVPQVNLPVQPAIEASADEQNVTDSNMKLQALASPESTAVQQFEIEETAVEPFMPPTGSTGNERRAENQNVPMDCCSNVEADVRNDVVVQDCSHVDCGNHSISIYHSPSGDTFNFDISSSDTSANEAMQTCMQPEIFDFTVSDVDNGDTSLNDAMQTCANNERILASISTASTDNEVCKEADDQKLAVCESDKLDKKPRHMTETETEDSRRSCGKASLKSFEQSTSMDSSSESEVDCVGGSAVNPFVQVFGTGATAESRKVSSTSILIYRRQASEQRVDATTNTQVVINSEMSDNATDAVDSNTLLSQSMPPQTGEDNSGSGIGSAHKKAKKKKKKRQNTSQTKVDSLSSLTPPTGRIGTETEAGVTTRTVQPGVGGETSCDVDFVDLSQVREPPSPSFKDADSKSEESVTFVSDAASTVSHAKASVSTGTVQPGVSAKTSVCDDDDSPGGRRPPLMSTTSADSMSDEPATAGRSSAKTYSAAVVTGNSTRSSSTSDGGGERSVVSPSGSKTDSSAVKESPDGTWYMKPREGSENVADPSKSRKVASRSSTAVKAAVSVHFHIMIRKSEFSFIPETDPVLIKFADDSLGGWNSEKHIMTIEKWINEKFVLMTGLVEINKNILSRSRCYYKYCMIKDGKTIWEFIPSKHSSDHMVDRNLNLPSGRLSHISEWHQYDGKMTKNPDKSDSVWSVVKHGVKAGWSKLTGKYHQELIEHTKLAVKAMLPSWNDLAVPHQNVANGERFLDKVDQVCYGVKNCFITEEIDTDHAKMKEVLEEYIAPVIANFQQIPETLHVQPAVEGGVRLATACCVLHLMYQFGLKCRESQATEGIFKALLIRPEKENGECGDYQQLLDVYFVEESWRKSIYRSLINFMEHSTTERSALLAIPLYHFLSGQSKPNDLFRFDVDHQRSDWWGHKDLDKFVRDFKIQNADHMQLNYLVEQLAPLISVDNLLPRTLFAVMSFKHTSQLVESNRFTPDVCMANIFFYVKTHHLYDYHEQVASLLQKVRQLLDRWREPAESWSDEATIVTKYDEVRQNYAVAEDLFREVCVKSLFSHHKCVTSVMQLMGSVLSNMQKLLIVAQNKAAVDQSKLKQCEQDSTAHFLTVKELLFTWLISVLPFRLIWYGYFSHPSYDENELQIYRELLTVSFVDDKVTACWKKNIDEHITSRIKACEGSLRVRIFCDLDFSSYPPEIEECFSRAAFEVLDDSSQAKTGDYSYLFDAANTSEQALRMRALLCKVFDKAWPPGENVDDVTIYQHILTWRSFTRFLGMFYGRVRVENMLHESCVNRLSVAVSLYEKVLADMMNGAVEVRLFNLLNSESLRDRFLEIFKLVEKRSSIKSVPEPGIEGLSRVNVVQKVIDWRQKELQAYKKKRDLLKVFVELCDEVKSDEMDRIRLQLNESTETLRFDEFCRPQQYTPAAAQAQSLSDPEIIFFALPNDCDEMLSRLSQYQKSVIFKHMWERSARKLSKSAGDKSVTVAQIVARLWAPVENLWKTFCQEMTSGAVTFSTLDENLDAFEKRYDIIRRELLIVCSLSEKNTAERCLQIQQYHTLADYSDGAKTMLKLRKSFQLQGDFKIVESLANLVTNKQASLRCITKELIDSGRALKEVTPAKIFCLEVFLKHKPLVDWLRQNVTNAQEVKVLVDLAMISAQGQDDLEVQKVSCLHAAATGYAPLIYDMRPDMGFNEFLPLCQAVWRTLGADPELPKKFGDTARHLQWLDRIKDSHGSVEVNALAQARAINENGIYVVGNNNTTLTTDKEQTLDKVVQLIMRVKGDSAMELDNTVLSRADPNERRRWQTLGLQHLNDLQSKLMLVAGKALEGKEQVDRFVEIFDGVTRLGNLHVRLCNAGCTLFQQWKATFYCNPSRQRDTRIEFGKSGSHVLKSSVSNLETPDLVGDINDLCKFMEDCLDEWLHHIDIRRMESYYLNHFTMQQLVILQNELAKVNLSDKTGMSQCVYPLLSTIRRNCSLRDLERAMRDAFQELASMEEAKVVRAASPVLTDNTTDETKTKELAEFFETMSESGFSNKLIERAVEAVGLNTEDATLWCLEHINEAEGDDEDDQKSGSGSDDEMDVNDRKETFVPVTYHGLQLQTSKDSMTTDLYKRISNTKGLLLHRLKELWLAFEKEMNTSVSDYLSLLHLGLLLEQLAQIDPYHLNRPVPTYLRRGRPNLIVCSQADVLSVVLSIYMHERGANLPLPAVDEVLVCNSLTTVEDVELLWRRAEGDARNGCRHGKIYTLVHAELLDYDVSHRVERKLEKHCHAVDDLRLVIVCCKEMEDRCHMINALDRFRVKFTPVDADAVRNYLKQHFTIGAVPELAKTAAAVDAERCCVRVVKSHRAGVGKTLKVRRLGAQLKADVVGKTTDYTGPLVVTIPLHCRTINQSTVLKDLREHIIDPGQNVPRIFHIDIAHEVLEGVDYLLFNLLVLGSITDRSGYVWTRSSRDLYVIEAMPLMQRENTRPADRRNITLQQSQLQYVHHIFELLPTLTCWSPVDSVSIYKNHLTDIKNRYTNAVVDLRLDQTMDQLEFASKMFQRPFQYLQRFAQRQELQGINCDEVVGTPEECIVTLLRNCSIKDPSWSELRHFVNFLNVQLLDCEQSVFCSEVLAPDLPGFLPFVVQFMLQMSRDFALRSLVISEETPEVAMDLLNQQQDEDVENILDHYAMNRRWETSPHPYVFFNADHTTFTFMGFIINMQTGDALQLTSNGYQILTPRAVPRSLQDALLRNRVNLTENFDDLNRLDKIEKMCNIMGIDIGYDPDPTYELTADNVKKMMAIYMRFRCGIPVIVMGETGCGKTRLIKFMCDMWKPPGVDDITNMILMKVHGGTTASEIQRKVAKAVERAKVNQRTFPGMQTVLFFDEANTTEEIGLIKEIMCDRTIRGQPLETHELKLIAACNPYRKHSAEMIEKLEHAGLGYHVDASQTVDKLGRIPMRHLVYRVQALPQSMLPLVWDFGQLSTDVEKLYIRQMVNRYLTDYGELVGIPQLADVASTVLAASQEFMRQQKDECSFVSLRDVDRTLQVMMWFYSHEELFDSIDIKAEQEVRKSAEEDGEDEVEIQNPDNFTRSLVLALGVCYHACLEKRQEYREFIVDYFTDPCTLQNGADTFMQNISWCQDVFLDNLHLGANIAKNQALKENVFMMVICIELRIPLFLVGKPGSSKSLAKTIVADAMQGEAARSTLYKTLKSVHMVSYQCSPLSTPEGIVGTFAQCAKLQENQQLDKFVSVVVLDEVGLAEDSPRMPLKALHPLLEDGCVEGDEDPKPHKKVGFIGISNWALDPAKMNRGILVQRGVPDEQELEQSALGICGSNALAKRNIKPLVRPLAKAYLELYEEAAREIREFFGLRDFYSLIKMVCGFATNRMPTWHELQHATLRNFGGLDNVEPLKVFKKHLKNVDQDLPPEVDDPPCDAASLIRASLTGERRAAAAAAGVDSESRYLLILTENYAALGILQQELLNIKDAIIIFGSSFPKDQEYTQVCRNINRIKVCMETGQTVVLLNLENLYESLYDALNQYYIKFGDQRFVDLGLGTQRVKCRVHQTFRLIVVAEKKVVIESFPIPLINRLEKHFLAMNTMLTDRQRELAQRLQRWAEEFSSTGPAGHRTDSQRPKVGDVFIGYHADTAASVILQVCRSNPGLDLNDADVADQVLEKAEMILLNSATPESIVRLSNTSLASQHAARISRVYFEEQCHENIYDFMHQTFALRRNESLFLQITTHSHLLLVSDVTRIGKRIGAKKGEIVLQSLQAFDTEQQFCKMLKDTFSGRVRLLIIQCDSGDMHADLIACARYNVTNEYSQSRDLSDDNESSADGMPNMTSVVFVIQLPRIAGGCFVGFQGGRWSCHHIDDLHPPEDNLPSLAALQTHSVSSLFAEAVEKSHTAIDSQISSEKSANEAMDVDRAELSAAQTMSVNAVVTEDVHWSASEATMDVDADEDDADHVNNSESLNARKKQAYEAVQFGRRAMAVGGGLGAGDDVLDVDGIIRKCVHSAIVMLRDVSEDCRQRKTARIEIILKLLSGSGTSGGQLSSLMSVLRQRIAQLLRDKEETVMNASVATSWLCNEAASFQSVNHAGFFRKAVWQYLETRVTPLLAGLIAYADANRNLDILVAATSSPDLCWLQEMWLNMFANCEITTLKYSDLQSAMRRSELTEFEVKVHGPNSFESRMPFSFVIKDQVSALCFAAKQKPGTESMRCFVERLHSVSPLDKILQTAISACGSSFEVTKRYLHDFVRMVYKPMSSSADMEFELVQGDLLMEAEEQLAAERAMVDSEIEETSGAFDITIPLIHLAYNAIHGRLSLFAQLAQAWPESVVKLSEAKLSQQLPLDLRSLIFVMESLTPSTANKELDNVNSRRAWSNRVRSLSPMVSHLFESVNETAYEKYAKYQENCRCTWARICALQLFIQHVCPSDLKEQQSVKSCMPFWNYLGETADFKTDKSLERVENFLRICNSNAMQQYFGKSKCPQCKETVEGPVELPCKHILCMKCVEELKILQNTRCPTDKCGKNFPNNFRPTIVPNKKDAMEAYVEYKRRCNSFFMDLVSRLCFADSGSSTSPPEPAAVRRLMGYITCRSRVDEKLRQLQGGAGGSSVTPRTKKMGLYDDALDATPVVRSFLLQLLLRSDINLVQEYLQEFFDNARVLLRSDRDIIVELCLLCVQCLEDHFRTQCCQHTEVIETVRYATKCLKGARHAMQFESTDVDFEMLEAIAGIRFGLMQCAAWLHRVYVVKDVTRKVHGKVRDMFDEAEKVFSGVRSKWPQVYLMRQIMRQHGMEALKQIGNSPGATWIIPPDARENQNDVIPDRFIVCGDHYRQLRELMAEVVIGKPLDTIAETLKTIGGSADVLERNILLALYREVTANASHANRQTPPQILQQISEFFRSQSATRNKELAEALVRNTLPGALQVSRGQSAADRSLAESVVHLMIVSRRLRDSRLCLPLVNLMTNANAMQNAYLPTMPQDDLDDVREALLAARTANENPTFYQCPNGHPYVIGNCGRPAEQNRCRACGANIGGVSHTPLPGNVLINRADNTPRRHVLGAPQRRIPVPERDMTAASTAILRLMLHMSMYIGATNDQQAIAAIIEPRVGDVLGFLWQHMLSDVDAVHTAIGRSVEDVFVLVHVLINHSINVQHHEFRLDVALGSKNDRRHWENAFVNVYIAPVLQGLNDALQQANNGMVNDNRLGNNTLLRMLYEVDVPDVAVSPAAAAAAQQQLVNVPAMWRYRSLVSLEHLRQELEGQRGRTKNGKQKESKYPVLELFIREEGHLRALKLLPNIVRLHRLLVSRFNRCIDPAEATSITVKEFLQDIPEDNVRREFTDLINDFTTAWNTVHLSLINFALDNNGRILPAELAQQTVDGSTCLAVLLPSLRDYGLCSVALVCFLCRKQNEFLEQYAKITSQKLEAVVGVFDAGLSHLVAFHPERELEPVILANCNYSLELGKGTSIEYDFATMEKQVEERFIRGRPRLNYECDFILFRESSSSASMLIDLRSRIPQDPLSSSLSAAIEKSFRQKYTDVNDMLANIDIAVGFLMTVVSDTRASLAEFMMDTLKMKLRSELVETIKPCQLRHVESLWILLSYVRACILANRQQDPFDAVDDKYHEDIPIELTKSVSTGLQHVDIDVFLRSLHECILFAIAVKQDTSAEDYTDNVDQPLNYVLSEYVSGRDFSITMPALTDKRFPEEIKLRHCVAVWRLAYVQKCGRRQR